MTLYVQNTKRIHKYSAYYLENGLCRIDALLTDNNPETALSHTYMCWKHGTDIDVYSRGAD